MGHTYYVNNKCTFIGKKDIYNCQGLHVYPPFLPSWMIVVLSQSSIQALTTKTCVLQHGGPFITCLQPFRTTFFLPLFPPPTPHPRSGSVQQLEWVVNQRGQRKPSLLQAPCKAASQRRIKKRSRTFPQRMMAAVDFKAKWESRKREVYFCFIPSFGSRNHSPGGSLKKPSQANCLL